MKHTAINQPFINFNKLIFYFATKFAFKKTHVSALLFFMFYSFMGVFAQSDDCTNPPALTVNATAVSGTTSGATQTIPAITCYYTGNADDDVFYQFTTSVAGNYIITVVGSGNFDAVIDLRTGACNGSSLACSDVSVRGGTESINYNAQANTTYYIRVYDYDLIGAYSNASNFTVKVASQNPIITTQPSDQIVCTSSSATFSVAASSANTQTYQWQMSPNNATWYLISNNTPTGVTYSGSSTATLTATGTAAVNSYYYRCAVTASGYSTISNSASLIINSPATITSNPTNVSMFTGASVNFSATATGAGITYQWQYNNSGTWSAVANGSPAGAIYTNAGTAILNVSGTSVTGNYQYRCLASGTCSTPVYSSAATLTVYQSSADNWNINGNTGTSATTNFVGTKDNTDFVTKANNAEAMRVKANGNVGISNNNPSEKLDVTGNAKISGTVTSGAITAPSLKLNGLSGPANRLLQTDATGNIAPLTMGTTSQVLLGDGSWATLPTPAPIVWQPAANGLDIFYNTGRVGIGTNAPFTALDVIGDARISNNLYVGGGIIITEKVNANTEVLTARMKADSIIMDSTSAVYGTAKFMNDVTLKSRLDVTGTTLINGNLTTNGNFTFAGNKIIGYIPPSNGDSAIIGFGSPPNPTLRSVAGCNHPAVNTNQFSGSIQLWGYNHGALNVLETGFDGANGFMEMSGANTALNINYYCGRNVNICTGDHGGNVTMSAGDNGGNVLLCTGLNGQAGLVGIGTNTPYKKLTVNGDVSFANYNTSGAGNTNDGLSSLEILGNNQTPTRRGISLDPDPNGSFNLFINSNQGPSAFNFKNGYNGATLVKINADGTVGIGTPLTSNPNGYKLAVNGIIGAKELKVEINSTTWPDFVFEKEFKLLSLTELEAYYKRNKHLPNIPSASEVSKNGGICVGDMQTQLLKKIEELTLYIIEQNKRIEALENK